MITPRCMAGISPDTLKKLKELLINQKEPDTELNRAVDRMIDMIDKELVETNPGTPSKGI